MLCPPAHAGTYGVNEGARLPVGANGGSDTCLISHLHSWHKESYDPEKKAKPWQFPQQMKKRYYKVAGLRQKNPEIYTPSRAPYSTRARKSRPDKRRISYLKNLSASGWKEMDWPQKTYIFQTRYWQRSSCPSHKNQYSNNSPRTYQLWLWLDAILS